MNEQLPSFGRIAFADPESAPGALSSRVAASLLAAVGDVAVVLDRDGVVVDVAVSGDDLGELYAADWVGRRWSETVAVGSRTKIAEMLAAAAVPEPRWRQVNHPTEGSDLPIRYLTAALDGDRMIAIGRDLRSAAAMQQRLLQTQQSLERDYLRLREVEMRYRQLFDLSVEPVLIIDTDTRIVREANPAAHRLLGVADDALVGQAIATTVEPCDRDTLIAYLGAVEAADSVSPIELSIGERGKVVITARLFRQARASMLLVQMTTQRTAEKGVHDAKLADILERMPDAFVLTDADLNVLAANAAFVEMSEVSSPARVIGEPLDAWLGRQGIDLELITAQLREHGVVRNVSTMIRGKAGGRDEVEVSAALAPDGASECFGFTIRSVGRRARDAPPVTRRVPRSVEQLTELVGRMTLKEIVRESTDLIERLCIEAALTYTSDNRASAAEVLGVSRQSLYSKLHRHGLGNLVSGDN